MSSVVEVLKDRKKCLEDFLKTRQYMGRHYSYVKTPRTKAEVNALGEALLALEQKERLNMWLKEYIRNNEIIIDDNKDMIAEEETKWGKGNANERYWEKIITTKETNRILKEVLEELEGGVKK